MHPNPAFRHPSEADALNYAHARGFGTLAINGADAPILSHIPFLISEDGQSVDLHLVRSNPILTHLPAEGVIAVQGPDGYVSPDWYGVPDQVPTWNYVAIHLRGRLAALPQDTMRDMLDRQSSAFETRLPKAPWTTGKMTPEVLDRMMRQIVPCRMALNDIQSTWKLNQNKPDAVRLRAAKAMENAGIGSETLILSRLMKEADIS